MFSAVLASEECLCHHLKSTKWQRDSEAAYESFRRVLLLDLDNKVLTSTVIAAAYYGMGRALNAAGIEAEATKNLERAVSLSPRNVEMQHTLARMLIEQSEQFGGEGASRSGQEEDKTLAVLEKALKLQYNQYLWVHLLAANQRAFEWSTHYQDMQSLSKQLVVELKESYCSVPPPLLLSFPIPSQLLFSCSRAAAISAFRHVPTPLKLPVGGVVALGKKKGARGGGVCCG